MIIVLYNLLVMKKVTFESQPNICSSCSCGSFSCKVIQLDKLDYNYMKSFLLLFFVHWANGVIYESWMDDESKSAIIIQLKVLFVIKKF